MSKSAKSTKYFELFSALKAGGAKGATPAALMKATGFEQGALSVYIHALRHKFGAEIESVRVGRIITVYRLLNADSIVVPTTRMSRTATTVKSKVKAKKPVKAKAKAKTALRTAQVVKTTKVDDGSVPVLDAELDIAEIGASELDDIRHSLGI